MEISHGKGAAVDMKKILSLLLCCILCFGLVSPLTAAAEAQRDVCTEEALAADLKELGLFQGASETDFDLERAPTRVEAVVMLIRVLGREQEALSGSWTHPFADVPEWAYPSSAIL